MPGEKGEPDTTVKAPLDGSIAKTETPGEFASGFPDWGSAYATDRKGEIPGNSDAATESAPFSCANKLKSHPPLNCVLPWGAKRASRNPTPDAAANSEGSPFQMCSRQLAVRNEPGSAKRGGISLLDGGGGGAPASATRTKPPAESTVMPSG